MANSKKTETPKKSGARCCSSKKQDSVNAKSSNGSAKSTTRTQSKKTGTTK